MFDLLARNGKDLRGRPYWKRRRKLEKLLGGGLPDGLVLTPATTDPAVARTWMRAHTGTGLEGVVAKRLEALQTRAAGVAEAPHSHHRRGRGRRHHRPAGGSAGADPRPPRRHRPASDRRPHHPAPCTHRRTAQSAPGGASPRLARTPARAHWGAPRTAYTRVRPTLVVEVSVDPALDGLRWRHPVRFIRARDDLQAGDLPARVL